MDRHPEMINLYKEWLEKRNTELVEYRLLPETTDFNTMVYLYADKMAMIFLREQISGLVIESEELFKVFKFMFDSLWKELEGKNLPNAKMAEEAREIQLKQAENDKEQESRSAVDPPNFLDP